MMVDDDPLVSGAMRRILQSRHEVLTFPSADEALDRLRTDRAFDVILCDLVMPGMSGVDLHREIDALDPALARRMVFMTGGVFSAKVREFLESVGNQRISKPIEMADLRALVAAFIRDRAPDPEA
jgi:CheY-like chemotaxis protein